jgi:hypothetical protein
MSWPRGKSRSEFNKRKLSKEVPASSAVRATSEKTNWKMKAGNNWETADETVDNPNRLAISPDLFPEGMSLEFKTRSVMGQEQKDKLAGYYRAGWTPVHSTDFDGRFANMWGQDDSGYVVYEACILCARPSEMTARSRKRDQAEASLDAVNLKAQAMISGGMAATGATHPSAISSNKINRTLERIDVPKE